MYQKITEYTLVISEVTFLMDWNIVRGPQYLLVNHSELYAVGESEYVLGVF